MKFGPLILSVLILVLVIMPCEDSEELSLDCESIGVNSEDHCGSEHEDLCSPFCICHCCQTHMAGTCAYCMDEVTFFNSIPSETTFHLFERLSFSIWDPPQLMS